MKHWIFKVGAFKVFIIKAEKCKKCKNTMDVVCSIRQECVITQCNEN